MKFRDVESFEDLKVPLKIINGEYKGMKVEPGTTCFRNTGFDVYDDDGVTEIGSITSGLGTGDMIITRNFENGDRLEFLMDAQAIWYLIDDLYQSGKLDNLVKQTSESVNIIREEEHQRFLEQKEIRQKPKEEPKSNNVYDDELDDEEQDVEEEPKEIVDIKEYWYANDFEGLSSETLMAIYKGTNIDVYISTFINTQGDPYNQAIHYFATTGPSRYNTRDIVRPVEKWELKRYKDRMHGYTEDSTFNGYYSKEAAIKAGKEFFEKVFDPEIFTLNIEDLT